MWKEKNINFLIPYPSCLSFKWTSSLRLPILPLKPFLKLTLHSYSPLNAQVAFVMFIVPFWKSLYWLAICKCRICIILVKFQSRSCSCIIYFFKKYIFWETSFETCLFKQTRFHVSEQFRIVFIFKLPQNICGFKIKLELKKEYWMNVDANFRVLNSHFCQFSQQRFCFRESCF